MKIEELNYYYDKFKYGEDIFHALMQNRVKEILLISTFYDAFIFEQDSRLSERLYGEYHELSLTTVPRITSVPTGEQALEEIEKRDFDLVITMMRIGEVTPFELSRKIKEKKPNLPVLLLLNSKFDVSFIEKNKNKLNFIDNVFLWNGDSRIFVAMIKYIEDMQNVENDTENGVVGVILLVEDDINFYSVYLPNLYTEIMRQTQALVSQELNEVQRIYRRRARPKVLMANTYEDAVKICDKYKDYLICVISDIRFPHNGELDESAGIELIEHLQEKDFDIAILLQSSEPNLKQIADEKKIGFINKFSNFLTEELRQFIYDNLGFGDFIFRDAQGNEIDRASSMADFEPKLRNIPDETLLYHARRNNFSVWLIAHGELKLAKKLRPMQVEDFETIEDLRMFLVNAFREVEIQKLKGSIIDFKAQKLCEENEIIRLSEGSLGGKGRGIAFLNALLTTMEFDSRFEGARVKLPKTAFIGTGEFDYFVRNNDLMIKSCRTDLCDEEIKEAFVSASLSEELQKKLSIYLDYIDSPIAVRSSGLLEDSQSQPFAGIYQTFMLPNNHPDKEVRQKQLEDGIKLVFSSIFLEDAKNYTERIKYRVEEEKMAVVIQEIVGVPHKQYYYPHFSGVAQSYNYYPTSYMSHKDGIATIALGLGQWVVEGENAFRFCPKYPDVDLMSAETLVKQSQTEFFSLNMKENNFDLIQGENATLSKLSLKDAEEHNVLWRLASVWDYHDLRLRDGLSHKGPRVLTFANILKYKRFPLCKILNELLDIGEKAFGVPVEIEFAVNLNKNEREGILPTFYVLQIRPLLVQSEDMLIKFDEIEEEELFLYTEQGMGNGLLSDIRDIIYIDPEKFDNTKTKEMKIEIQEINEQMNAENREYILIGPGRWGSRDRFLGVPVYWADINKARVIVETGLQGFTVEPSQGSHFFHNLVAVGVGYFTVPYKSRTAFIDWDWLKTENTVQRKKYSVHIRREEPFVVKMFGRKGISVICK